jgi:hypothetical protein
MSSAEAVTARAAPVVRAWTAAWRNWRSPYAARRSPVRCASRLAAPREAISGHASTAVTSSVRSRARARAGSPVRREVVTAPVAHTAAATATTAAVRG